MLAHRRYQQQINVPDIFTRLLCSVILTGLAPESFYRLGPDDRRPRAHYDGLAVDFIAAAIVDIGAQPHRGIRTFNVLNPHQDDGISLDTFVDWIREAGYVVERVPDYAEWLNRFEAKLRALPEEQRQHSSLGVLDSLSQPAANEQMASSRRFQDAVGQLPIGPEVPHLSREFIFKCLRDMSQLGLIPEPEENRGLIAQRAAALS